MEKDILLFDKHWRKKFLSQLAVNYQISWWKTSLKLNWNAFSFGLELFCWRKVSYIHGRFQVTRSPFENLIDHSSIAILKLSIIKHIFIFKNEAKWKNHKKNYANFYNFLYKSSRVTNKIKIKSKSAQFTNESWLTQ